jgi:hypothetical protein
LPHALVQPVLPGPRVLRVRLVLLALRVLPVLLALRVLMEKLLI